MVDYFLQQSVVVVGMACGGVVSAVLCLCCGSMACVFLVTLRNQFAWLICTVVCVNWSRCWEFSENRKLPRFSCDVGNSSCCSVFRQTSQDERVSQFRSRVLCKWNHPWQNNVEYVSLHCAVSLCTCQKSMYPKLGIPSFISGLDSINWCVLVFKWGICQIL